MATKRLEKRSEPEIPDQSSFGHRHYVPILKWRQGEYQALLRLDGPIKNQVIPLLEIPEEKWDFENEVPAKTLDEHLSAFGRRLSAKWGKRRCFVDSCYLNGAAKVDNGMHHLAWIFELARTNNCRAVPVFGFGRDASYMAAVAQIVSKDQRGACLRLVTADFDEANTGQAIQALLSSISVSANEVDLVIDGHALVQKTANEYAQWMMAKLKQLPMINEWRTLTVAGTAFPEALPSNTYRPSGKAKRTEWLGYKALVAQSEKLPRIPAFGDYSVAHPKTEKLDPRLIDPTAKIKYSIDDNWFIVVGEKVKENGRAQYVELCKRIVRANPRVFAGSKFSWGDDYIFNVKTFGTGGPSTWPSVGTNHHITRVVNDLASFHGV